MRRKWAACALVMLFVAAGRPLSAHHSFAAEFDSNKPIMVKGVVTKVEWMNPHIYFYVDVKDETTGKIANWAWEMGSPNALMRNGWSRNSLKVGDVVTVDGTRAKDGSNKANARGVILASTGKRILAGSSEGTDR